jgi:hypothetical protein
VDLQYGCAEDNTGSEFILRSYKGFCLFSINDPFKSVILPERDYVKRSESVERTWKWMTAGSIDLGSGKEQIVLKLLKPSSTDAGIIKAIRLKRF